MNEKKNWFVNSWQIARIRIIILIQLISSIQFILVVFFHLDDIAAAFDVCTLYSKWLRAKAKWICTEMVRVAGANIKVVINTEWNHNILDCQQRWRRQSGKNFSIQFSILSMNNCGTRIKIHFNRIWNEKVNGMNWEKEWEHNRSKN